MLTTGIQKYGKYWPKTCMERSLQTEATSLPNCLIPYLTTVFSWYMELRWTWRIGLCPFVIKWCSERGISLRRVMICQKQSTARAFQTSFDNEFLSKSGGRTECLLFLWEQTGHIARILYWGLKTTILILNLSRTQVSRKNTKKQCDKPIETMRWLTWNIAMIGTNHRIVSI